MDTDQDRENEIQIKRHSFAHLLAMAVLSLFKETKIGIGAVVDNGFYQEVLVEKELNNDDLIKISEEMKRLISLEIPYQQINISKNEAFDILHLQGQIFKTEILDQIPDDMVSFYKTGNEFFDLCKGPHINHSGNLGPFQLTQVTKVRWNNDETRPVLQRIYGVAFNTQEELEKFIEEQNQIKEKNYLKTGCLIDLFMIDEATQIPILLPKGLVLQDKLIQYLYRTNIEAGFKLIKSPLIQINQQNQSLELATYSCKDLLKVFKQKKRSYKNLPFKLAQINYFFSTEKANSNIPLLDQIYTQADIGILVSDKESLKNEINLLVSKILGLFRFFGLNDFKLELALKGPNNDKYYGNQKEWYKLQNIL